MVGRVHVKRILLAVDRGAPSWEATRLAVHLAPSLDAEVTVLTVLLPEPQDEDAKDQRQREYKADRELVDDITKELASAGARAHGEVRSAAPGRVDEEILAAARRGASDLIVMGSRARGELAGMLLGSVSRKVAEGASCPVLVVPTGAMASVAPRRMILVIDAATDRKAAVAVTAELARSLKASVDVVCVGGTVEWPSDVVPAAGDPDERAVARTVASLKKSRIEAAGRVVPNLRGLAAEIAREALTAGADLIVIGSRSLGWLSDDLSTGVVGAVVRRTHRPVVVTPRRRKA